MKRYVIAGLLVAGLAMPAFAATKWFVVVDTVSNCSVIEGKVGGGKTAIIEKDGFDSHDAAKSALQKVRGDESICKGVVE